jgi:hypothetical protein
MKNAVSPSLSLTAGALLLFVGCYSNNGGHLYIDAGPGGGDAGSGGTNGSTGGTAGAGAGGSAGSGGGAGGNTGSGGTGGNPLTGEWQPPVVIDSHDGTGLNPHVSIGANGEAVSVWVQTYLGEHNVWANRYTPPTGWEGDLLIGATDGNVADPTETSQPYVVVDEGGVATAVWATYTDPVVRGLVSRRSAAPGAWGDPRTIYDGPSTAGDARLAVDASGNVMAVFATGTGAWANYFQPADGWGGAKIIEAAPNTPIGVQVALEPDGDGRATWTQAPTGVQYNVFSNVFSPESRWSEAAHVEEGTLGNSIGAQLALDANGNALFIWGQVSGLRLQVWSNGWDASKNEFTDPVRVDSAGTAYEPVVASDLDGNGTAVWIQSAQVGGTPLQIAASRYTPGSGWSTPETLAEGDVTGEPRVAMDSQGNAVAVYAQQVELADQVDAWAHTYSEGAWSAAVRLGLDERTGDAFQPSVAMDLNGNAVAVWREGPDIWASTFE